MTDLEISKALALAIGWKPEHMVEYNGYLLVGVNTRRVFHYDDWNVIGPIAVSYYCFPKMRNGQWYSDVNGHWAEEETPQKAIAMAVIKGTWNDTNK